MLDDPKMPASDSEMTDNNTESDEIIAKVRALLCELAPQESVAAQISEGENTAEVIDVLRLPSEITAAVLIYPLYRDQKLPKQFFINNKLQNISRHVLGLEQVNQFSLPDHWQPGEALAVQQSEALRKMLLAVVADVRLVLVRIAEQLQRLRDARDANPEQQRALALESREIYAPLANRLGVWQLKWEMEDLAFRFLDPVTYSSIARSLNEKRTEREDFIDAVKQQLSAELSNHNITAEISGRPKHIYSIWRKMQRKERGLEALYDIRAVRILVADVNACYAALGAVHNLWSYIPGEFDDYIANPKENDYQSLHTAVVGPNKKTVEIQIRSHQMHRHAELGVAAHWRYKEGAAPAAFDQKIGFLRQLLEPDESSNPDLLDQVRDEFFEDHVYAISPKGDVVELAANATPLDFAYHVHTQIGHRCRGAKVNGRIVPLTYTVKNGDQIEIITGRQPQPSRDWLSPKLGYLASARARAKVRNWYRQQDRDLHLRQGKDSLEKELTRLNEKDVSADRIARQLKLKDAEALHVALGCGDLTTASIATALHHMREPDDKEFTQARRTSLRNKPSRNEQPSVAGVGDLMSNFARCCRPVPPEAIVGYITKGRGVSIHRADCGNFLGLNVRHPERVLNTTWGESSSSAYPVEISLYAFDRNGLIRDITSVLADENASVLDLSTRADKKTMQVMMNLSIEIQDLPTLSTAINRLEQIPNVVSVRRKA